MGYAFLKSRIFNNDNNKENHPRDVKHLRNMTKIETDCDRLRVVGKFRKWKGDLKKINSQQEIRNHLPDYRQIYRENADSIQWFCLLYCVETNKFMFNEFHFNGNK